ncbi:MAG: DCC1-like thiol-disulfide oxidoreductase family protein [Hyphomicrobiales bacterium]|uniref:thiol-disulfide oxidoreductase DCC family protein n=1 Tax=Shimia thalassica TaxID=1715693 RepID=UPI00329DB88D
MEFRSVLTIIFDTDCLMCSAWVRFILRHERKPSARFVSAWSEQGIALASQHKLTPQNLDETYLVVIEGRPLIKSDATFAIFRTLNAPWRWATALRFVPRSFRDWFYDQMAKNRYRWFGQQDQCFVPPDGQQARFVLGPPRSAALPDHR